MISFHQISSSEFVSLANHADDADAVRTLRASQYSRRVLLLRAVLEQAIDRYAEECQLAGAEHAFHVLANAQMRSPKHVNEVLLHPQVGSWLGTCLRNMGQPQQSESLAVELAHLGAIAASAAMAVGDRFALRVPVHDSRLVLPLWGSADVPTDVRSCLADLRTVDDGYEICCGGVTTRLAVDLSYDQPGWRPVQRLTATADAQQISVVLDDVDPYRLYHGLEPAEPLAEPTVDRWRSMLDEAWAVLAAHHRALAKGIAAGLSSVVPLATSEENLSGTSSDAFGAAAITLPHNGVELAVALVHEFQHSKLGALLDLVPLLARKTESVFYAPWREDPRPLHGILHGCFAYYGVAGFWRAQRLVVGGRAADLAHFEFALWREAALRTSRAIAGSELLTEAGRRFVVRMCRTLAIWQADEVRPAVLTPARLVARDHRLIWQLRNLVPDQGRVWDLARAWCANRPCPDVGVVSTTVIAGSYSPDDTRRRRAWRRYLEDPDQPPAIDPTSGDASLVRGEHAAAARRYRAQLEANPARLDAWSGYVLAREAAGAGHGPLHRHPEVVYAVHRAILEATGAAPDPLPLADWLAPIAE